MLGPTASGKTSFSVSLAQEVQREGRGVEIINADSRQCYKYLDVGTAKITDEEKKGIPHQLFDLLDPSQKITVAWYKEQAEALINDLHAQKKIPMLVGGSMLYLSSVIDDLQPLPKASDATRKKLEEEWEKDGGYALQNRLKEVDPETAASIPLENKIYVIRALEIFEETGKAASSQKTKGAQKYDLFIIGIHSENEALKERITKRLDQMLQEGWIEEVHSLLEKGYSKKDPGMESHGYRELMQMLRSNHSIEEVRNTILSHTLAYAKRQRTWWRRDKRIRWVTPPQLEAHT